MGQLAKEERRGAVCFELFAGSVYSVLALHSALDTAGARADAGQGAHSSGPRLSCSWAYLLPEPEFSQLQHRVVVVGALWGLCLCRQCFASLLPRVLEAAAPCIYGTIYF